MSGNKWFILTCFLMTIIVLAHLHKLHYDESVADVAAIVVEAILAAGLFIIACFYIFNRTDLQIASRLALLSIWAALMVIIAAYSYSINRIKSAPNFLRITSGHFGFEEFSLKKDGRYIYQNASFLGSTYNYGSYMRRDSIITLLPNSSNNAPQQLRLIIRPYHTSSVPGFDKRSLVFAINKDGKHRKYDSGYQGHRIVELSTN